MPSAELLKKLQEAERYVAEGEDNLRRQRQLISEIELGGHDPSVAKDMLTLFERVQMMHVGTRDRLAQELEEAADQPE